MRTFVQQILAALGLLPLCQYGMFVFRVFMVRIRYLMALKRIRVKKNRIRVLFLVHNTSKWKAQSLYEALTKNPHYEPLMAVNYFEVERDKYLSATEKLNADIAFYQGLGNKCVIAYDVKASCPIELSQFRPDVVFYQEPWSRYQCQSPKVVSSCALCCYMPYSMEYMMDPGDGAGVADDIHFMRYFHQMMFVNFTWGAQHAEYYLSKRHWWERAGKILGLGHTIMDQYRYIGDQPKSGYTIYAPHFSIEHNATTSILKFATFKETGFSILEYAKRHPEFNWLFKPHPVMRRRFIESGYMTAEEVDRYFDEWGRIGTVCTDGDYPKLFNNSRALISDSGSFLMEYAATGRPIIRPVPENINVFPCPAAKPVIDSLYETYSVDDLLKTMKMVLEDELDPKKDERIHAAREAGLVGQSAAVNIVKYFNEIFDRK